MTDLPLRMRNLKIENGRVTFTVPHEFEVALTLMGDGPAVPWRLLKINILVEDKETSQGKALVHALQVRYVEHLVQSRLVAAAGGEDANNTAMRDLYDTLHHLCLSLQLEVLHAQTQRLCHERLTGLVRVEEYRPGRALTVSYWRERKQVGSAEVGYRFSVQVDVNDLSQPLIVLHAPPLEAGDARQAEQAIRSSRISLEGLLVHSIHIRTKALLKELKEEVERRLDLGDVEASLHGSPALLSVPILQPCLRSELLVVSVDTHTGVFLAHVSQYENDPVSEDIEHALNSDKRNLEGLVSRLRAWITKQRVHKTLQHLPATSHEMLPLLYDHNVHPLKDLSGEGCMFIRLHRHPDAVLVLEFSERAGNHCEMQYKFHFLYTRPASIEEDPNGQQENNPSDVPRVYLKALSMVEVDPFLVTHDAETKVDAQHLSERIVGKRKVEAPFKRTKFPAYFISDLAHVVSFADERLPFALLQSELNRRGVGNTGAQVEDRSQACLALHLVSFPKVAGGDLRDPRASEKLQQRHLSSAAVRLQSRVGRLWKTELRLISRRGERGLPPAADKVRMETVEVSNEVGDAKSAANAVKAIVDQWTCMVHVYDLVVDLQQQLAEDAELAQIVRVAKYDFKTVQLVYGPGSVLSSFLLYV